MADSAPETPERRQTATPSRRAWLAWLLSLALHGVVLVVLVWWCHVLASHPSGGGGGAVLAVDLAGLGSGDPGPLPGSDAAAGENERPRAGEAASPRAEREATPEDASESGREKALPVLAASAANAAPKPAEPKRRLARRTAPRRAPAAATASAAVSGQSPKGPGANDAPQAGPSGIGPGLTGEASGQGNGTGGGSGGGEGPSVGPGRGAGEEAGMSLAAVDVKPRILRQVEPAYPADARRHRIEGRVVARLLVTADGGVHDISIVSAKPPRIFEQAVMAALEQWKFHPARYKGREVATWVMLPIRFDLKD